jgi:hypothetical protein
MLTTYKTNANQLDFNILNSIKLKYVNQDIQIIVTEMNKDNFLYESEYNTYPYKPDVIKFDEKIYDLSEKLDCSVFFEDNNYIIVNEKFDLSVWGETREEAEQAFNFAFSALFQNFAKENDDNLSNTAKKIKDRLLKIVKAEYSYETKKK